jgi:hypothetical protein
MLFLLPRYQRSREMFGAVSKSVWGRSPPLILWANGVLTVTTVCLAPVKKPFQRMIQVRLTKVLKQVLEGYRTALADEPKDESAVVGFASKLWRVVAGIKNFGHQVLFATSFKSLVLPTSPRILCGTGLLRSLLRCYFRFGTTFIACGPLGPSAISNSTFSPC